MNQRRAAQLHWDREKYAALFASYRQSAIIVQYCVALLLFSAMAATASLVFLEISALRTSARNRFASRLACWLADYAPVLFALASLALLVSFRPFAAAFAQFRSGVGPLADARFFDGVYFSLLTVLPRGPVAGYDNSYYRWWAATVALAAVALLIALRGISRRNSSFTQK